MGSRKSGKSILESTRTMQNNNEHTEAVEDKIEQNGDSETQQVGDSAGLTSQDVEEFEALFSQFGSLRDQARGMQGQARLDFAEKVVEQFWDALNLSDDEM